MSSWPVAGDVSSFLADAGYDSLPSVDLGELVDRAVDEVHSTVGFAPFLASTESDYTYSSRDGIVVFDRPFGAIVGVEAGGAAVEFVECPQGVTPIRKIILEGEFSGEVTVAGRPGFGLTIPFDIWYAVRDLAASFVVEMIGVEVGSELESVKQDSVTLKYRSGVLPNQFAEILADRGRLVINRYRFVGMGG